MKLSFFVFKVSLRLYLDTVQLMGSTPLILQGFKGPICKSSTEALGSQVK